VVGSAAVWMTHSVISAAAPKLRAWTSRTVEAATSSSTSAPPHAFTRDNVELSAFAKYTL